MSDLRTTYRVGPSVDASDDAVQYTQDVEPYLEENKRLQGMEQNGFFKKVAQIPNVVTMQWMTEDGIYWPSLPKDERGIYLRRKLNDPQYQYLKTTAGKV